MSDFVFDENTMEWETVTYDLVEKLIADDVLAVANRKSRQMFEVPPGWQTFKDVTGAGWENRAGAWFNVSPTSDSAISEGRVRRPVVKWEIVTFEVLKTMRDEFGVVVTFDNNLGRYMVKVPKSWQVLVISSWDHFPEGTQWYLDQDTWPLLRRPILQEVPIVKPPKKPVSEGDKMLAFFLAKRPDAALAKIPSSTDKWYAELLMPIRGKSAEGHKVDLPRGSIVCSFEKKSTGLALNLEATYPNLTACREGVVTYAKEETTIVVPAHTVALWYLEEDPRTNQWVNRVYLSGHRERLPGT